MSKSVRPSVSFAAVMTLVLDAQAKGLVTVEEKHAWEKVEGPNGHRIYIARQSDVRDIQTAGFGRDLPNTLPLKKPNGTVEAQLDLSVGEEQVLALLTELIDHIQTLPKAPGRRGGKSVKPSLEGLTK